MNEYSIVVATRNRSDVLQTSLRLFLGQTRLPSEIIVVDSSDDHDSVRVLVDAVNAEASGSVPISLEKARAANLTVQRNQGLELVTKPIVIFPDDDSYWYPDTAAGFLYVYDQDTTGVIGGVSGKEVDQSPISGTAGPERRIGVMQLSRVRWWRHRLENILVPHPFNIYGREQIVKLGRMLTDAEDFALIETLGGFRMSFRTDVVRALGFDEALGRHIGYAQHEDKDMSLRILADGKLLAAAHSARVFHNVHPAPRTNGGFEYGFCQILNYAYIVCKVTKPGDAARSALERYCKMKAFAYGLRRKSTYQKDITKGARAALKEIENLTKASPENLKTKFIETMERHIGELV